MVSIVQMQSLYFRDRKLIDNTFAVFVYLTLYLDVSLAAFRNRGEDPCTLRARVASLSGELKGRTFKIGLFQVHNEARSSTLFELATVRSWTKSRSSPFLIMAGMRLYHELSPYSSS